MFAYDLARAPLTLPTQRSSTPTILLFFRTGLIVNFEVWIIENATSIIAVRASLEVESGNVPDRETCGQSCIVWT